MKIISRNTTRDTLRNGKLNIVGVNVTTSSSSGGGTLTGDYLPATPNEDGTTYNVPNLFNVVQTSTEIVKDEEGNETEQEVVKKIFELTKDGLKIEGNIIATGEVSAYGKNEGEEGGSVITIVDNLESTETNAALSANQGRVLNEKITALTEGEAATTIADLLDTSIDSAEEGQILKYNAATGKWYNTNLQASTELSNLSDVTINEVDDKHILIYNKETEKWENQAFDLKSDDVNTHLENNTIHITDEERTSWNNAVTDKHTHSNKTIIDGITADDIKNWDAAHTNNHTHSNKTIIDGITADDITNWNGKLDKSVWDKAFYFDANNNNNLKVKVNVIGEKEISAYGSGTSTGTGAITIVDALTSTSTTAALSANQGRVLKSLIDAIDVNNLDLSTYYKKSEVDTLLGGYSKTSHGHTFASLTEKPTTLSGYGITDAATVGHTHTKFVDNTTPKVLTLDHKSRLPYLAFSKEDVAGAFVGGAADGGAFLQCGQSTDTNYAVLKLNNDGTLTLTKNGTTASTLIHSGNYNSYSPSLTGSGASGNWGISITGNATTATTASNSTKFGGFSLRSEADFANNKIDAMIMYTIDATALSTSNFYPVVFTASHKDLKVNMYSTTGLSTIAYNQNTLDFLWRGNGWNDTPQTLVVYNYNCYTATEMTIGCLGMGSEYGTRCIWVRGGLTYYITSNQKPYLKTSNYSYQSSTFTVGTTLSGGTNTKVNVVWTPQTTSAVGKMYHSVGYTGNLTGTASKATADASGNNIVNTYATKTALSTHTTDTTVHITAAERTKWNSTSSNWDKAFYFDANNNNNLKVKVNVIGEKEISAYGSGTTTGTGAITIVDALTSTSTTAALSANQGRVLKALIDAIDVNNLDSSYYKKTEVNNLLSGKSDTGHSHDYLPLTGGTMSGVITLTDNSSYINSANGNAILAFGDSTVFTGASSTKSTIVGSLTYPIILRTSGNDLWHYRSDTGTKYRVLDTSNSDRIRFSSFTTGATKGWYRIATTTSSINNNIGTFYITSSSSGYHTDVVLQVGVSFGITGMKPTINQLACTGYQTSLTQARLVYHATAYSGYYSYIDVYLGTAIATTVNVKFVGNGWDTLSTTATTATIPSTHTSTKISFVNGDIVAKGLTVEGTVTIKRSASAIKYCNTDGTVWGWLGFNEVDTPIAYMSNGSTNYKLLHSGNYNSYSPSLTGSGASGTWAINITGNAATATKIATARTLWGQSFNGTANVSGALSSVTTITMSGALQIANSQAIKLANSSGTYKGILSMDSGNNLVLGYDSSAASYNTYIDGYNMYFRTGTAHTTRMTINSTGRIGVGTTSPTSFIDIVNGTANTDTFVTCKRTDTGHQVGFGVGSGGINRGVWDYSLSKWLIYADSTRNNLTNNTWISQDEWANGLILNRTVAGGGCALKVMSNGTWIGSFGINGSKQLEFDVVNNGVSTPAMVVDAESNLSFQKGTNGRYLIIKPMSGNICHYQTTSGGWAMGNAYYTNAGTATGGISAYGNGNTLEYYYFGKAYNSYVLKVDANGNCTASGEVTAHSDRRLKTDIQDLEVRGELRPVKYKKDGKESIGFIAQEVQELYPELVMTDESTEEKYLSLNYAQLTAVLYAELKALKKRIAELEQRV